MSYQVSIASLVPMGRGPYSLLQ